jgi:hypothetical protein
MIQRAGDFERLVAVIGLRHDQVIHIDVRFYGVDGIERVFGIDKGSRTAGLLGLRDPLQRQRVSPTTLVRIALTLPGGNPPTPRAAPGEIERSCKTLLIQDEALRPF